jgi:hypothetical protein
MMMILRSVAKEDEEERQNDCSRLVYEIPRV